MRLPADAALIVIDVQQAIDDPVWGPRNNIGAEASIAALIAAWRERRLADLPHPPRFRRAALALSSRRARPWRSSRRRRRCPASA